MTYDEYKTWLPLAEDKSALPTTLLSVAEYMLDPFNWEEMEDNGEDTDEVVERAMSLLYRCAKSDAGEDGVHRGRAGKLIGDIYYYPEYHVVMLEDAAHWYEWAAVELRHAPMDEIMHALRQAERCYLYSNNVEKAVPVIQKMEKVGGCQDGWADFAQYGFEHNKESSATSLLGHLFELNNLAAIFMAARTLVPQNPGEELEDKELLIDCLQRLIDAYNADSPDKNEYISVVAWYLYTQDPDKFIGSKEYKQLVRGAKEVKNMWCNYYLGQIMLHELSIWGDQNEEGAKNAYHLMRNCFHFASDRGCRSAIACYLEVLKAYDSDNKEAIKEYQRIADAFDVYASKE